MLTPTLRTKNTPQSIGTPYKKQQLSILQTQMKIMTETALPKLWTQLAKCTIEEPLCQAYVRQSCAMQEILLGGGDSDGGGVDGSLQPILNDLIHQSCRLKVLDEWVDRETGILRDAYKVIVEGLLENGESGIGGGASLRIWLAESISRKVKKKTPPTKREIFHVFQNNF